MKTSRYAFLSELRSTG